MSEKKAKVAPVPRGFRSITPHITTPDVADAVAMYQAALGATVESTQNIPDTETLVFALIKIGNSYLTIGLGEAIGLGSVSLHLYVEDADAAFEKASEAGFAVLFPVEEKYWGDRIGLLSDPLGIRWSIGQRVARLTADEKADRARAAFGRAEPGAPVADDAETADAGRQADAADTTP